MHKPLISLIIPVHNSATTLHRCLESVASQTFFSKIEVIIIHDPIRDGSKKIIEKFLHQYPNMIYKRQAVNKGLLEARRTGVMKATASYIMHLDSDDAFSIPQACELAYTIITSQKVEIASFTSTVHFDVTDIKGKSKEKIISRFAQTHSGHLFDKDIFTKCFIDKTYTWNLWGKIFSADLHKKAYSYIPKNSYSGISEDFLTYFINAFLAKSFYGDEQPLVLYHYGYGISTLKEIDSAQKFGIFLKYFKMNKLLKCFLRAQHADDIYYETLDKIDQEVIDKYIDRWQEQIPAHLKRKTAQMLFKTLGEKILHRFIDKQREIKTLEESAKNITGPYGHLNITGKPKAPANLISLRHNMLPLEFCYFLQEWIEPNIHTILFYAYYQIGLMPWTSCEGHYDKDKDLLLNTPTLSFWYTTDVSEWLTTQTLQELQKLLIADEINIFVRNNAQTFFKDSLTITINISPEKIIPLELILARQKMFDILRLLLKIKEQKRK